MVHSVLSVFLNAERSPLVFPGQFDVGQESYVSRFDGGGSTVLLEIMFHRRDNSLLKYGIIR